MDNRYFKYAIQMAGYTASKYAGAGMRGKFCIAVHCDNLEESAFGVTANIVAQEADEDNRANLAVMFNKTKSVSHGSEYTLYWPDMEWTTDPYYMDEPNVVILEPVSDKPKAYEDGSWMFDEADDTELVEPHSDET